jgi:hypothetical protein
MPLFLYIYIILIRRRTSHGFISSLYVKRSCSIHHEAMIKESCISVGFDYTTSKGISQRFSAKDGKTICQYL